MRTFKPIYYKLSTNKSIPNITTTITNNQYRNYHKDGPELLITKILMLNGPLKSKEIWRCYEHIIKQRKNQSQKTQNQLKSTQSSQYFQSLSQLKKTLKFMRNNNKICSNGYLRREKEFLGWKINEKRALKFVHPQVISQIRRQVQRKDYL